MQQWHLEKKKSCNTDGSGIEVELERAHGLICLGRFVA